MITFSELQKEYAELLSVCLNICESAYRFFSTLSSEQLKESNMIEFKSLIDQYIADPAFKDYLNHRYILKDKYQNLDNISIDTSIDDDSYIEDSEE